MVIGVVLGAALAPFILNALSITNANTRPWAAALVLVVGGSLGSTLGYWLGGPLRNALTQGAQPARAELTGGALFSALAVLGVMWFLGFALNRGPNADLAKMIQTSALLHVMNRTLPPPPAFLAGVEKDLADVPFPNPFLPGTEPNEAPLAPPTSINTAGVRAAMEQIYRVEGRGCGGIVTGSAYPIGQHYLITDAHVVSGTSHTTVSQGQLGAQTLPATVVLFDPERDVAVLYVRDGQVAPLVEGTAARGTQGAVIGYPGGGNETEEPAVVNEQIRARGYDIYNQQQVDRDILILQSLVRPGNSGGPLVDLNGHVIGMVFAASSTNPNQAYALTNGELQGDIDQGLNSTAGIDTANFSCAV